MERTEPFAERPENAPRRRRRWTHRLADAREYVLIGGLFVFVVAGLVLITYAGIEILSSVRAYTNAEALYSKGQKDAVYYLHQYAISGKEEYYDKYRAAIMVPLGYRQVRAELDKARPDVAVIRRGMEQGRMHPDDGVGRIWLFRLLRRVGTASQAIRIWGEADLLVGQLQNVAGLLHEEVRAGAVDRQQVAALLQEVERINVNLTTLEGAFSSTLGEAAHGVRRFVLGFMMLAALMLLGLGLVPSWGLLKRLKDSEDKFRRLFEQSRDAIVLTTLDDQVSYANPAALELFGHPVVTYKPGRPVDLPLSDYFVSEKERQHVFGAVQRDGFIRNVELQLRRLDGTVFDALVTSMLIRDRRGYIVGFESILRDISERKRTERRMRLLERAVEASGNVILISDATRPDFPVVYVNPAFERITGYTTDEAIGQNGFFLLSADEAASEQQHELLEQALREGDESRVVLRNYRKDGTPLWNEVRFAPVYDVDGTLINYVGIQTDVTESQEAAKRLQGALRKEQELSELQARFVSMASHEFRTPLATILSSAELVERFRHQWDDERTLKHLHRIQSGVKSLTNLLENVLLVGKVEAGRLLFQTQELELGTYCRELIEEVWAGYGADRRIEVHLPSQPLRMQGDPDLLRYLLSNLLTNAAKYSPVDSLVEFTLERHNGHALIQVRDEGIGIPEDDLRRVVEPFHRGRNAETIPGTGLGLSIAKRAVELHGGSLKIESEEGSGTLVAVTIPLQVKKDITAAPV